MLNSMKVFPNGLKKAFTLSYDDGVEQDKKLVSMLNQYGLRATFNINSGIQGAGGSWVTGSNRTVRRMEAEGLKELYRGHETAVHSLTHPHLENLPEEQIYYEISEDKKNLEGLFGYPIRGMAYPYGTYNELVKAVLKRVGIEYSRTTKRQGTFDLPGDYHEWHPTCHYADEKLMEMAREFVSSSKDSLQLFYVWGHSYEFDERGDWDAFEEFCRFISGRADIWYATNIEILDVIK